MDRSPPKLARFPRRTPSVMQPSEASLLGIEDAIGMHLDTLYRTARALTGDHAAAEDLVQETAIRAC